MEKVLIFIIILFPLTILAQDRKCCETEREVENYLVGNWQKKDSDPNKKYRFEFNNGVGTFMVFTINEEGVLEETKEIRPAIKILKKETGFVIENDFEVVKTYSDIKALDSNILILARRDGLDAEYHRILE